MYSFLKLEYLLVVEVRSGDLALHTPEKLLYRVHLWRVLRQSHTHNPTLCKESRDLFSSVNWCIVHDHNKFWDELQVLLFVLGFQSFAQLDQEVENVNILVRSNAKLWVDHSIIGQRWDCCWGRLNLVSLNHTIVRTNPGSVLDPSGVERCFIDPDEPSIVLD